MNTKKNIKTSAEEQERMERDFMKKKILIGDLRQIYEMWLSERISHLADELTNKKSSLWLNTYCTIPYHIHISRNECMERLWKHVENFHDFHLDELFKEYSFTTIARLAEAELSKCVNKLVVEIWYTSDAYQKHDKETGATFMLEQYEKEKPKKLSKNSETESASPEVDSFVNDVDGFLEHENTCKDIAGKD